MNSAFPQTINQRNDLGLVLAPPGLDGFVPLT